MKKIVVEFIMSNEVEKLVQECADEQGLLFDEAIEELMTDGQLSFDDMTAIDWKLISNKKPAQEVSGV